MTASATIIADSREEALTLPLRAVRNEDGRSLVTVVERDGEGNVALADREVEMGLRAGDRIEIVSGLRAGDEVFIADGA
jgi:multidrug efflux pump subunit AcrA (membrane-fusion protein)